MKKPTNRKAVVISTVLTALILAIAGTAVFAWDRISATSATQTVPTPVIQQVSVPATQTVSNNDQTLALEQANAEIAAYKVQLQQAAQALNDAYAQINACRQRKTSRVRASSSASGKAATMGASSFFGEATVAEPRRTPTTGGRPRRSAAASAAWKSGLLASGFGAVLLGWALLARAETPTNTAALTQPQPNVMIAQAPAADTEPPAQPAIERRTGHCAVLAPGAGFPAAHHAITGFMT